MDVAGMLGDTVTFTCTATGIPIPDITWSSDNMSSIEATTYIVMGDDNTIVSILRLSNLQAEDFVYYTCTATNMFGSDDVTALLGSE